MCNYFAMVILVLDGHYREHLREEQKKDADRESRAARNKSKRTDGASGLQKRRHRKAR